MAGRNFLRIYFVSFGLHFDALGTLKLHWGPLDTLGSLVEFLGEPCGLHGIFFREVEQHVSMIYFYYIYLHLVSFMIIV